MRSSSVSWESSNRGSSQLKEGADIVSLPYKGIKFRSKVYVRCTHTAIDKIAQYSAVFASGYLMRKGIPNLGALQAFEATARLGSFSRAAEELSLTHSAVFRQVVGLEERLGVQLFNRHRRRLSLTDAGREYAARVRHHLEQLEKDTFALMSR